MTRIRVFQDGEFHKDGCVYYRTHLPGQTLVDQGANVELCTNIPGVEWRDQTFIGEGGKIYKDPRVVGWPEPECDIAVFQRPLTRDLADLITIAHSKGIKVVVDMDDDFFSIPKENKAWRHVQPETSPRRNTDHLKRALALTDLITVTTPALARRYKRKSVVLPNYVPSSFLARPPRPFPEVVNVGWTGTRHTHPHDLESTRGGVARALTDTGAQLHIVGDGEGVEEALGYDGTATKTGWVPLPHYPDKMNEIDVGMVPLHASAFNQGKSWLKGLEFSALGIPFVASNTQAYVELSKTYQLGDIARGPRDWTEMLTRLIVSPSYAEDRGEAARETVRQHLTIESHAEKWLDAWMSTVREPSLV